MTKGYKQIKIASAIGMQLKLRLCALLTKRNIYTRIYEKNKNGSNLGKKLLCITKFLRNHFC
jgi:hypothetical protein